MRTLAYNLKSIASTIIKESSGNYWVSCIKDQFGLDLEWDSGIKNDDFWLFRQIYNILRPIPPELIRGCGVIKLILDTTMGPNKPYYPNHGFYRPSDKTITLNADIFYHPDQPDDFFDYRGYFISRPSQTLLHELGHALDACLGDASLKPDWLSLSGWSPEPKKGLQRLLIKEKGSPPVIGEWYFNPSAGFTRFYAKRNPYDDWADSFAFYLAGLKSKIPTNKLNYFNILLTKYFK